MMKAAFEMALVGRDAAAGRQLGEFTFKLTSEMHGGRYRPICSVSCARCERVDSFGWHAGYEPVLLSRRMRSKGWDFDPYHAKHCVCPDCKRKGRYTMPEPAPIPVAAAAALADAPLPNGPPSPAPPKPAGDKSETPSPGRGARALTPDEKSRIRRLLDEHFDEELGNYLDGYSDQRIGREVDVPWSAVTHIRELAYGPIREDQRITQLRNELLTIKEYQAATQRRITEFEQKLMALTTPPAEAQGSR